MLKNYIIIAIRNILKERIFSFIKISGLAVGVACFMVVVLYVEFHYKFERHFTDHDKIYRLEYDISFEGEVRWGTVFPGKMSHELQRRYSTVESATNIIGPWQGDFYVKEKSFHENFIFVVDSSFFSVFRLDVLEGDTNLIAQCNTVIVAQSIAQNYFGGQSAIGKTIFWGDTPLRVVAVVEDPPLTSDYRFDFLVSHSTLLPEHKIDWETSEYEVFVRLSDSVDVVGLGRSVSELYRDKFVRLIELAYGTELENLQVNIELIRLDRLHIFSDKTNRGLDLFISILLIIALFILVLAGVNYINLSTSNAIKRAKEISLRRINGASQRQIIIQLQVETVIISLGVFLFALIFAHFLLPFLRDIIHEPIPLNSQNYVLFVFAGFFTSIVVGGLSGIIPTITIARFSVIESLQKIIKSGRRSQFLRSVLVCFQLVVLFVIIFIAYVLNSQFKLLLSQDYGFDTESIAIFWGANQLFKTKAETIEAVEQLSSVEAACFLSAEPGSFSGTSPFRLVGDNSNEIYTFSELYVDEDYFETFEAKLLSGNFFSGNDSIRDGVVINHSAVERYGIKDPLLAKFIYADDSLAAPLEIVGVAKDMKLCNCRQGLPALFFKNNLPSWTDKLCVRFKPGRKDAVISHMQKFWNDHTPNTPFEYSFYNERIEKFLKGEKVLRSVFIFFSLLSLFIACLGVLGLIIHKCLNATKQIAIHKVNGAGVINISFIMSRQSIVLSFISVLIASPIAYMFASSWLKGYAVKIEILPVDFILLGFAVMLLVMIIENIVVFRIARNNPVANLRSE